MNKACYGIGRSFCNNVKSHYYRMIHRMDAVKISGCLHKARREDQLRIVDLSDDVGKMKGAVTCFRVLRLIRVQGANPAITDQWLVPPPLLTYTSNCPRVCEHLVPPPIAILLHHQK